MERNKQVVAKYVEAFNAGDYDSLQKSFAPDAAIQGVLGKGGLEVAIPIWRDLHTAFGIHLIVGSMIAEGNYVAVRYTERGKFVAPFRGNQPTGKSYELGAVEWFIVEDGKIKQRWGREILPVRLDRLAFLSLEV
jgi:ketosteroid isomerase-like protein